MQKINKSVVATGGSQITNSGNTNTKSLRRVKAESSIIGFLLGIVSSVIASLIYDFIKS